MHRVWMVVAALFLFCASAVLANEGAPQVPAEDDLLGSLTPQLGTIELLDGVARLEVPEDFRYIDAEDTRKFLEQGWGNPDGSGTLGMLLPVETDLFGDEGWGVVITYQEDGYVEDDDAAEIDYDELLASMQQDAEAFNAEREKLGYEPVDLVGWAEKPHYDSAAKKLYWAKELRFGQNQENTLNYNVRILGRKGVLVLNAVGAMSQLPAIRQGMDQVLAFADFQEGHRYSDYDSGVDKVAAYGIATLIGGKVAAKVGLLAKLGALLLAFKKFIFIGLVAIGGLLVNFFKRKKAVAVPPVEPPVAENAE